MRKIEIRAEKEKKESRNKTILGVILAGLMVLSTAGYAFFSMERGEKNDNIKVKYNNFEFVSYGDLWQTEISGYKFYFSYLPNETRQVNIKKTINDYA